MAGCIIGTANVTFLKTAAIKYVTPPASSWTHFNQFHGNVSLKYGCLGFSSQSLKVISTIFLKEIQWEVGFVCISPLTATRHSVV